MTDEHPWMSKDLLVRLRWWAFKFCGKGEQENLASDAMSEAVSRIEKLVEENGVLFVTNVRLNSRADLDSDGYVDRIEKLEAALREAAEEILFLRKRIAVLEVEKSIADACLTSGYVRQTFETGTGDFFKFKGMKDANS
jgi:hypothetical protein